MLLTIQNMYLYVIKFETEHTLINSHPNEYSKELEYYLFGVKLGKCFESCNTLNELSNRVCVSN